MNPLTGILSPRARKYLYLTYSLAALIVGALAVADVNVQKAPDVIAYLGVALGLTAASNIPTPDTDEPGGDDTPGDLGLTMLEVCYLVIAVGVAVLALIALGVIDPH
jgi:hypothetical protein